MVFRNIRDYFAGNVTGVARDEQIAENIIRLLFCKIYDERHSPGLTAFSNRPGETCIDLHNRMTDLFNAVRND